MGRLHYIDEGSGRAILMLHGNPTWSFLYRNIIRRLSDRFRCIAVDYPGFGLSDRPDGYGYTPREHAEAVFELVEQLGLEDHLVMAQDWGGPIGMSIATRRPEHVSGLIFGSTWFWPPDSFAMKAFSRVLSSAPMQRAIVNRNFFVERLMPPAMSTKLSAEEMDHYRRAQPTPEARRGVAEFPRQILAAGPWLAELFEAVRGSLSSKPLLLVWGTRDNAFPPKRTIPRWREVFEDRVVVALPGAKHYIQEDAPNQIADAVIQRFG